MNSMPIQRTPSSLAITNSQLGLIGNSRRFWVSKIQIHISWLMKMQKRQTQSGLTRCTPMLSTGEPRESLTKLRTKSNVVHAGLSQLFPQLNLIMPLRPKSFFPFQSNKSLIATKKWTAAMVVSKVLPSNISKRPVLSSKKLTHTRVKMEFAKLSCMNKRLRSLPMLMFQREVPHNYMLPLIRVQSLYQSKPIKLHSNTTRVAS